MDKKEFEGMFVECLVTNQSTQWGGYYWSVDEDYFTRVEFHKTRDSAVQEAVKMGDPKKIIWTACMKESKASDFAPVEMVEELCCIANEKVGISAFDWPKFTSKESEELDKSIAAVIQAWSEKYGRQPNFGAVMNKKKHLMRIVKNEEDEEDEK